MCLVLLLHMFDRVAVTGGAAIGIEVPIFDICLACVAKEK
jgi:hypothetical protein